MKQNREHVNEGTIDNIVLKTQRRVTHNFRKIRLIRRDCKTFAGRDMRIAGDCGVCS
jgi:hypothetical protein